MSEVSNPREATLAPIATPMDETPDTGTGSWISKELTRVEEANLAFYEAFSQRDIQRMSQVWSQSPHARCVHPGWELVVGWNDIRQSWNEIFRTIQSADFQLEDVHVEVCGRVAWVNLVVLVEITTDEGELFRAAVVATNLFELMDEQWVLVLHHSSNFAEEDGEAEEEELEIDPPSSGFSEPN